MPTLREFILAGSSLPTGNTIRDHLNNQSSGGSGIDRTFYSPFKSSIKENMTRRIKQSLSSNLSGNDLNSSIKTLIESQVSTWVDQK